VVNNLYQKNILMI